jgi:hypothetical protein
MKRLFNFKYHKIVALAISIVIAYFLFKSSYMAQLVGLLNGNAYLGVLIGGGLFAFAFTAPLATAFFIALNPSNILLAAVIGSFGAVLMNLAFFSFLRISFIDEFRVLERTHPVKVLNRVMERNLGHKIKAYLLYAVAGLMLASPLPDEVGILMFAGLAHIRERYLAILSFVLHLIGLYIILSL